MKDNRLLIVGILIVFISSWYGDAFAQTTPVTQYPCDKRSTANNNVCPAACVFVATIEKGCNCFDSADNDGDGKKDAADPDCATYFGLSFSGSGSNCSLTPPTGGAAWIGVGDPATSSQNTSDTQSKVSVGDIDNDGTPDAVITSKWNSKVRIIATTANQCGNVKPGDAKAEYDLSGKKKDFEGLGCASVDRLLFEHEIMIADIDRDGDSEIFTIASNRSGNPESPPTCFFLVAFTPSYKTGCMNGLTQMYIRYLGTNRPGSFGIADFDGDGKSEVYMRDRIFAAETGRVLATEGGKNMTNTLLWDSNVAGGPVAVDFDKDGTLDLIVGAQIYKTPVLTTRIGGAAPLALTPFKNMNSLTFDINSDGVNDQYFVKLMTDPTEYGTDTHSSASVADINEDGFLDVVISGAITSSTGRTSVFYWDVQNNKVRGFCTPKSTELGIAPADDTTYTNYLNGWIWGTGRVNLGDANGDGKMDLSLIAGSQLFCLTTTATGELTSLWTQNAVNVPSSTGPLALGYRQINDSRSGVLTVTIYDFDNDGNPEMVYRDSQEIVVVDGETGTIKIWSDICQSHTYTEGPVIADMNGDGATDIGAACFTSTSFKVNAGLQQQALGQIRMWFSNDNAWLPTRAIWNQPGYFVVNVNDDLTIPYPQFDQMFSFGSTPCPNGIPGPNQPMNVFMNQVPILSANGCPVFPAPDLAYVGDPPTPFCNANPTDPTCDVDGSGSYSPAVVVIPPICGNLNTLVYFNIINSGDLPITDTVPVTFYNGNPTLSPVTATKLKTEIITISNLAVGATYKTPTYTITGPGTTFELYMVLYNDGTVLPVNLAAGSAKECTIGNNMYNVTITPDPISATIEKLADNSKCVNSAPNNGSLKVHVFKGLTEVTALNPYSFQWYSGIGTGTPIAGMTTTTVTGLAEGDYTVVVTDIAKGCTSLPISMTVARLGNDPTIQFKSVFNQSKCNPADGKVEAEILEGNAGYTFEWFDDVNTPIGISGVGATIANGLSGPKSYVVRVSKDGCTKTSGPVFVGGPLRPDIQASVVQHVVDCANPNSGIITANAFVLGALQPAANYTFNWYYYNIANAPPKGSILPGAHGTGNTRTALPVGSYQVEVLDIATGCFSLQTPNVTITSQTVVPSAPVITQVTPQTSCNLALPNGALTATATIAGVPQAPAGFTFEWFKGLTTLPADKVPATDVSDTNGRQVNKVSGGGIPYTVKVTTPLNCSATANFVIAESKINPVVTLAQLSPNSICDPANATSPYNGSVRATVTFNGVAVTPGDPNYTFAWFTGTTTGTPFLPAPADNKARDLTGLVDGNYTVVVTRTDLFCVSVPDTEPVLKTSINPVLSSTSTGSNNCNAGFTPDGTVTVQVTNTGASPGPFSYQWYDGSVVGVNPLGAANNGNTVTAIKVGGPTGAPRPYTVKVLNTATGCVNNTTQSVSDISVTPVLSTSTQPNSICVPTPSVPYNGSMTVGVTNIPALYTLADYTFAWYTGSTTASPLANLVPASTVLRPGLDVGTYSVIGTNTKTGCVSAIATNQVANLKKIPTLTPSSTGSNNCVDNPALGFNNDGTVTVATTVALGPFNYQWYKGSGNPATAPGLPVVPTAVNNGQSITAIGLGGPVGAPTSYTVLVTDQLTGCNNFVTTAVADNSSKPVLSTSTAANNICSPPTSFGGSMTVGVTNIPALYTIADYTFDWYTGSTTASPLPDLVPATTLIRPTLDVGTYSVIGTNTKTGCVSIIATNQVANGKVFPTLTPSSTGNNNCTPGTGDGTATVTVNTPIAPATFTYQWYTGTGNPITTPLAIIPGATSATETGLGGPTGPISYTALVTINGTGCTNYSTATVADNKVIPVLSTATQPNSICFPATSFNGSMTVGVTNIPAGYVLADHTFVWYTGTTTATPITPAIAPATTTTLSNRDVGSYTVVGTNTKTGCVSLKATNAVANGKVLPTISATSTGSHNCTLASPSDGTATVTVTAPAASNFTYQWYVGTIADPTVGTPPMVPPAQGGTGTMATAGTGVATGLGGPVTPQASYTVLVTRTGTGCTAFTSVGVADISAKPTFTITPTNNSICNTAPTVPGGTPLAGPTGFNGNVAVTLPTHPVAGGTYTYQWYTVVGGVSTLIPGSTASTLPQLDNGMYAATITRTEFGCVSDPKTAEVLDAPATVTIATTVTPSNNCAPVAANGNAVVTSPTGGTIAYQWYNGSVINGANIRGTDTSADLNGAGFVQGSATGNFTVLVTNLADGCQNNKAVLVTDAKVTPTISLAATPNTVCDATKDPNGTLVATVGSAGVNFTIDWIGDAAPAVPDPADEKKLTKVKAGPYSATVKNDDTGCISAADAESVVNSFTYPTVVVTIQDQTSCSATPNGALSATANATNTDFTTYDYNWYTGNGVVAGNLTATDVAGISARASGDYTVAIAIAATGCTTVRSSFIPNDVENPTLTMSALAPVTLCETDPPVAPFFAPDGSAEAVPDAATVTGADYTVYYVRTVAIGTVGVGSFPTDPQDVIDNFTDFEDVTSAVPPASLDDLSPGYLTAVVVDNNSECRSTAVTVPIVDGTAGYDFSIVGLAQAGQCTPGAPGGSIIIDVDKDDGSGPAPCATCTYAWYHATPTNSNINFFDNPPVIDITKFVTADKDMGVADPVGGVVAGTYTIIVQDAANGCGDYEIEVIPLLDPVLINPTGTPPTECVTATNLVNNGSIEVEVVPDADNDDGYTLNIYKGNAPVGIPYFTYTEPPASPPSTFTKFTPSDLDVGDYLIEVIDLTPANIACPQQVQLTLTGTAFKPVVTIDQIFPNTSCDPSLVADGAVTLIVDQDPLDGSAAPNYSLISISPPPINPTLITAIAAPGGLSIGGPGSSIGPLENLKGFQPEDEVASYTIRVQDDDSFCFQDAVVIIPDQVDAPSTFAITPSAETMCAPASNGSALAVIDGTPALATQYDFEWYRDSQLSLIANDGLATAKPGDGASGTLGGGELLNLATAVSPSGWALGTSGFGSGDRVFFARAKKNATATAGIGCYTSVVQVSIDDDHLSPNMALTPSFDTFCGPAGPAAGDGTITVVADQNPATGGQQFPALGFIYDWENKVTPPALGIVPVNGGVTASFPIPDLANGVYTVTVTNADNSCIVVNDATILQAPYVITVNSHTQLNQQICLPNGDITVTQITVDRTADPTAVPSTIVTNTPAGLDAQYLFKWYTADPTNPGDFDDTPGQELNDADATPGPIDIKTLANNGDAVADADEFDALGVGTYYVVAERSDPALPGFGCPSLPYRVDLLDDHENPEPFLTALSNTSCLPAGPGEGEILITVSDEPTSVEPVTGYTYTYTWPAAPGRFIPAPYAPLGVTNNVPGAGNGDGSSLDGDDDHYSVLLDNAVPYLVHILNDQTGCSVDATATIVKNATPVFVQNVTLTDEILCAASGDGSITVTKVSMSDRTGANLDFVSAPTGLQGDIGDFDFEWVRGSSATLTLLSPAGDVLDNTTYAAPLPGVIGAGTYKVTAKRKVGSPGAGCPSAPFTVTILDKKMFPVVALTPFSNTSCTTNPADPGEGEIKILASDNSTAPVPGVPGFTYTWGANPTVIPALPFPAPNDGDSFGGGETDLTPAPDSDEDHPIGLREGAYTMTLRSNKSGCTTNASTTILKNALPVFIQDITAVDQVLCNPDGSLTVTSITVNKADGTTLTSGTDFPLTDFEFDWSRDAAAGTQTTTGPGSEILDPTTYAPASFGGVPFGTDTYTVVGRRIGGGPGNGCVSTPFDAIIQDKRIFPVVTLTPFANTSCSSLPADLEGEITIEVEDNIALALPHTYTYTWSGTNPTAIASAAFPAPNDGDGLGSGDLPPGPDVDEDHATVLAEGTYNMTVQSNQSGCTVNAQTVIFKNSTPVFTQLVVATDQVLCTADGKLVVNEVRVVDRDGVVQSNLTGDFPLSDFAFRFDRGTLGTTVIATTDPAQPVTQLDNVSYTAIAADVYFVIATRVAGGPGLNCSSPEYKVDILDKHINPIVALTPLANTSCDPGFFEGEIEVRVSDASVNLPAPLLPPFTYTYDWDISATPLVINGPIAGAHDGDGLGGGDADGAGFDNDGDHPRALMEGAYTLIVTNTITGCTAPGSATIFKNSTPVFTQLVVPTHQVLCNPDGMLVVSEVQVVDRDGNVQSNLNGDFPLSDFAFRYDRGPSRTTVVDPLNALPVQPVTQLDNLTYPGIGFDEYYVYATRVAGGPGLDCLSAPYKVDIEDKREFPTAAFTSIANSTCNMAKPNGSVTIAAEEQDGTAADPYTFTWTLNGGAVNVMSIQTDTSPTSTLADAQDGDYVVTVTNTVTGCPFDGSFNLTMDPTRATPNIIDVVTVDPLNCLPSASASVTKITLGSNTNSSLVPPNANNEVVGAALLAFTYNWMDAALVPLAPLVTTPVNSTLVPGTYFVTVIDPTTDCESGRKEIEILDDAIIYPVVNILQTAKQISCLGTTGTAALAATGDGQNDTNLDYTFSWHPNLDVSGAPFATTSTISGLTVGDYSVNVLRGSTGCAASALYIVPDDSPAFTPGVLISPAARTLCVGQDGGILARVVNLDPAYPFPYNYLSDMYNGGTPVLSNPPDFPNMALVPGFLTNFIEGGLPEGIYTVRITDINTGCSGIAVDTVHDRRTNPIPEIVQDNPLTTCDPVPDNGQLAASADGGLIVGYTFEWYAGTAVPVPAGTPIMTGDKLIGQTAGDYVMRATVNLTGCFADKTDNIQDATVMPPSPDPLVERHRTDCVTPNGWVSVTVQGVTLNYTFDWYDGSTMAGGIAFNGLDYQSRDVGPYTVTAKDVITGCVSQPATVLVEDKRVIPQFVFETHSSYCVDTGIPHGTGSVQLLLQTEGVVLEDVVWYDDASNAQVGTGPAVYELFPGVYRVEAVTTLGCPNQGKAEVGTEISPYNGISQDNDGLNEAFTVDCISNFPNNNVKIFNRNGILVYEADGYNNQDVVFGGEGQKGVYLQGVNLPAGTYFYIIDKRDGSKPVAGYLELER